MSVLSELGYQQDPEVDRLSEKASPEAIARSAAELGCSSVAFTYNDPVVFLEYAIDTAQACHEKGIRTVAATAGEICEKPREEFFRHTDAAKADMEGFTERLYHELCAGWLRAVLDTLEYVRHKTHCWLDVGVLSCTGS
jgi:pyruvate formate lyase activating enzyme